MRQAYYAEIMPTAKPDSETVRTLAHDLMKLHCDTGISLDNWAAARAVVETFYGPIRENEV